MIEMDEAFDHVIRLASENGICGVKEIPLHQVTPGQVLAEDVIADQNHPQFRASTMDGYAVNSVEAMTFRLISKSLAGAKPLTLVVD